MSFNTRYSLLSLLLSIKAAKKAFREGFQRAKFTKIHSGEFNFPLGITNQGGERLSDLKLLWSFWAVAKKEPYLRYAEGSLSPSSKGRLAGPTQFSTAQRYPSSSPAASAKFQTCLSALCSALLYLQSQSPSPPSTKSELSHKNLGDPKILHFLYYSIPVQQY